MRSTLKWKQAITLMLVLAIGLSACQAAAPAAPAPQEPAPQEAAPVEAGPQEAEPQEAAPQEAEPQETAPQEAESQEEAAPAQPSEDHGTIRQEGAMLVSDKHRDPAPQVDPQEKQALVDDSINFLFDLYPRIQPKDKNFFFSPFSISLAMAMLYAGARGETEKQIGDVMHFNLPQEKLHPAFNALAEELMAHSSAEGGGKINLANSIWGQQGRPFRPDYLDTLAENYGAGLFTVDFTAQPEEARRQINEWVSKETENKIPEIIGEGAITPLTRLVMADAIYFKSAWEDPFDPAFSDRSYFFFLVGGQTLVETMTRTGEYAYVNTGRYEAIEIPYAGGDISMVIIMPKVEEFLNIEKEMNTEFIKQVEGELQPQQVTLTMPRFTMETSYALADPLIKMGILNAFATVGANFSGIDGTRDLFLEEIGHQAYINVDEAGTEAAAATALEMKATSIEDEAVAMTVNHPYIFFIRDRQTNVILFFGRMLNPSEKSGK